MHKKTPDGESGVVHCEVSSPPLSRPVKGGQMVEVAGVECDFRFPYSAPVFLFFLLMNYLWDFEGASKCL
jgi:hypothetical protein